MLPAGTVLVAMVGQGQTRGRTALLAIQASCNQNCFAIMPSPERFVPEFIQLWFRHNYLRIRRDSAGRGNNQPIYNGEQLRDLEIDFPIASDDADYSRSLSIQRRIAADLSHRLAEAERLTAILRDELAAIDALPAALLREAFAGQSVTST